MTQSIVKASAATVVRQEDLKPINNVQELAERCRELAKTAIVLTPIQQIDQIPDIYQISLRVVVIDTTLPKPNANGPEVYHSKIFHGDASRTEDIREVGLGRVALNRIMGAAGYSLVAETRTDDRSDPLYAECNTLIAGRDFDGTIRQFSGTAKHDLRKGSEEAAKMTPAQLSGARRKIVERCMTFALERAIRGALGIQHSYKLEDLRTKPFVVPKLIPNANQPEMRRALLAREAGATQALFGSAEEPRVTKDATPERTPPPPLPQRKADDVVDAETVEDEEEDDDDIDLSKPIADGPALILCTCPCGHQLEIAAAQAEKTMAQVGGPRCPACAPSKRYDHKAHKDLRTMGFPKYPEMGPDELLARVQA